MPEDENEDGESTYNQPGGNLPPTVVVGATGAACSITGLLCESGNRFFCMAFQGRTRIIK